MMMKYYSPPTKVRSKAGGPANHPFPRDLSEAEPSRSSRVEISTPAQWARGDWVAWWWWCFFSFFIMSDGNIDHWSWAHCDRARRTQWWVNLCISEIYLIKEKTCVEQGGSQRSLEGKGSLGRAAAGFEKKKHCFHPFVEIVIIFFLEGGGRYYKFPKCCFLRFSLYWFGWLGEVPALISWCT